MSGESKTRNSEAQAAEKYPGCVNRLRRIEGQVRGIARMVEQERYCIEILTQMQAVKAALARVEDEVLRSHADSCVEAAIRSGDEAEQRQKFAELVELMRRSRG
jgi:DNA-binding FrmR family transcriptional regulator